MTNRHAVHRSQSDLNPRALRRDVRQRLESLCNYGWYGPAESTLILADYAHEFWIVPDFEPGQLVIAVAAERPVAGEWFERATPVIESITAAG